MTKKQLILLSFMAISGVFSSQNVGINTESPKGTLHVKKDVTSTTETEDFLVKEGKVSIGHTTPEAKIDIKTTEGEGKGFKMVDGSQKEGRVLTSDANGVAKWEDSGVTITNVPIKRSPFYLEKDYAKRGRAKNTGIKVTLPPGKYIFTVSLVFQMTPSSNFKAGDNGNLFIRARFWDQDVTEIDRYSILGGDKALYPRYAAAIVYPKTTRGYLSGSIAVENNTSGNKDYWLFLDNASDFSATEVDRVVPDTTIFQLMWNENSMYYQKMIYNKK